MKVVSISNFGDETIEDKLIKDNILTEAEAKQTASYWNQAYNNDGLGYRYAVVKPDDYVLWRGMADLVGD